MSITVLTPNVAGRDAFLVKLTGPGMDFEIIEEKFGGNG
jgi:hypothetical protein